MGILYAGSLAISEGSIWDHRYLTSNLLSLPWHYPLCLRCQKLKNYLTRSWNTSGDNMRIFLLNRPKFGPLHECSTTLRSRDHLLIKKEGSHKPNLLRLSKHCGVVTIVMTTPCPVYVSNSAISWTWKNKLQLIAEGSIQILGFLWVLWVPLSI